MLNHEPIQDLDTPMSQEAHVEVMNERAAVVKWLKDAAAEYDIPALRKIIQHEATGIENGLHRMEP